MIDTLAPPTEDADFPQTRSQVEAALLRPLAQRWNSRIKRALKTRKPWETRAAECRAFYRCATDLIWNGDKEKGIAALLEQNDSKFRFVLGKAFELVAVFGPSLFYTVPHRRVTARKIPDKARALVEQMIAPLRQQQAMMQQQAQMFGVPAPPPSPVLQLLMQDDERFRSQAAAAEMMELWLNYTPNEQPGTLAVHGKLATIDAMITGRGVLFARPYRKASGRLVTGLFREEPERLLVDPDHKSYQDASWIALKRIEPTREVEAKFNLPPGTLKKKLSRDGAYAGSYEDSLSDDRSGDEPADKDLFCYWEVFSKRGVGLDSPESNPPANVKLAQTLDAAVGRYAYLAICPGCEYPLNAYPDLFVGTDEYAPATPEQIAETFAWPFECWRDDRFPCEVLDFYPDPEMPYPIAPLTPGMGELKFMNYMMSRLANRIDSSCRDFIAAASAYYDDVKKAFDEGGDLTLLRVSSGSGGVDQMVKFLQQPQVNFDAWKIMDAVSHLFEQRTGLNDLAYGGNPGGTQSRTAADAANKREATMIRPQYMQQSVEEWMSRASGLEAMTARAFVKPEEIVPVFGNGAALVWGKSVWSQDMNQIAGEFEYRVDAGSMRRPNKEQLIANLNQLTPVLLPFYQGIATNTGNIQPFNALLRLLGDSIDQDMSELYLQQPPLPPPPPPMPPEGAPPEEQAPPQEQAA